MTVKVSYTTDHDYSIFLQSDIRYQVYNALFGNVTELLLICMITFLE